MTVIRNGRSSVTVTTKVKRIDRDREVRLVQRLPKAIREFVLYDCPFDVAVPSIIKSIKLRGKDETLRIMRAKVAQDTAAIYGPNHPQAKGV